MTKRERIEMRTYQNWKENVSKTREQPISVTKEDKGSVDIYSLPPMCWVFSRRYVTLSPRCCSHPHFTDVRTGSRPPRAHLSWWKGVERSGWQVCSTFASGQWSKDRFWHLPCQTSHSCRRSVDERPGQYPQLCSLQHGARGSTKHQ